MMLLLGITLLVELLRKRELFWAMLRVRVYYVLGIFVIFVLILDALFPFRHWTFALCGGMISFFAATRSMLKFLFP